MDLFGIKEHDQRHDEVERQLRRLIEQVAQLGIDLGVTRTELRKLDLKVAGKVSEADLDPSFAKVNSGVIDAREKLAAAQGAAEENWSIVNDELSRAMADLRRALDGAND
jgi:hypothetical protein